MTPIQRIKPYEAKKALTTLLSKVAYGKKPVILESRGHDLAALISMEHFHALQDYLARMEDEEDWKEAEAALAESKGELLDWEDVKRDLKLSDQDLAAGGKATAAARTSRPGQTRRRH
ncbi:MAG TPA: type II toxin-antitoxin system prevent-host-death family antitoxin [bacterium]